ncbi:hypothetical protein FRC07_014630, partial [Ceratobasidium sp. 392]
MDKGGDTEREVDNRSLPPISHAPARPSTTPPTGGSVRHTQSAVTPGSKPAPLGRLIPRSSIVDTTVHSALSRRCPGGTGRDGAGWDGILRGRARDDGRGIHNTSLWFRQALARKAGAWLALGWRLAGGWLALGWRADTGETPPIRQE